MIFFSSLRRLTPPWLQYLFWIFTAGMILSAGFRLLLLVMNLNLIDQASSPFLILSFYHGLAFDARVISGVVLIPYLILMFFWLFFTVRPWLLKTISVYFVLASVLVIGFYVADLPYFDYYGSRLSIDILTWSDSPGLMAEIVLGDWAYIPYILFGFLVWFIFWFWLFRLESKIKNLPAYPLSLKMKLSVLFISLTLIFWGVRGNYNLLEKPAVTAKAFFSDYTFINQLTINPLFNLIDSKNDFEVRFSSDSEVIQNVRKYLNITDNLKSPIARSVQPDSIHSPMNVILILLESQTAYKTSIYGKTSGVSPFLDSLALKSLFFKNTYSTGVHTRNGIYGTMTGYPTIMGNRIMNSSKGNGVPYGSIPLTLKQFGYSTTFFCTGKKEFDRMGAFLTLNGIDKIYNESDYPKSAIFNKWGVTDDFLFSWSLKKLDELDQTKQPFFVTYLTISAHENTQLAKPKGFVPTAQTLQDQRFQLADWSLQKFFHQIKNKPWYSNTLFVLVADHGFLVNPKYGQPLSYFHIPLLFFSPSGKISPQVRNDLAIQIDIFPTLMGILNLPYINNSLGIDLQRQTRPFAYFSSGTNICCINDSFYLVFGSGNEFLYNHKLNDEKNRIGEFPELAKEMKRYTLSMMQVTQYITNNRLNGLIESPRN